ncbi:YopX domain-containing protein [Latilactobacillus phage TMW 1.1397 P1]|nr:YopX domain-containing protein [Latilactobacillus phage TMW 1.1397 P1]
MREIKFRAWKWADETRVCGNIYKNPELLEEEL